MLNKTQNEIIKNWQGEHPVVSICCLSYNHEKYIAKALDSFLMQETDFPFEIVIHDDASTDQTADIIRIYEEQYPTIFKPLYQTENQKSKVGAGMNSRFNHPRSQGRYIAHCETDDYWTDPKKLQKQVDFMTKNPDCSLCFHDADLIYGNSHETGEITIKGVGAPQKFNLMDFIEGKTGMIPNLTILFKASIVSDMPAWYYSCPVGDLPLKLLCGHRGKLGYLPETMAVHIKASSPHAWSYGHKNIKWILKEINTVEAVYNQFDQYTQFQYHAAIKRKIGNKIRSGLSKAQEFCNRKNQLGLFKKHIRFLLSLKKRNLIIWSNFIIGHRHTANLIRFKQSLLPPKP